MTDKTRIAIVGIGGIGGYFGTRLCNQYSGDNNYDIIFIQRGEHLKAIKENGLKYITRNSEYNVSPSFAIEDTEGIGTFDVVFFCVKSSDLINSALSLSGNISKDTILIPTLNGVNNTQRIRDVYPDNIVLSSCIYVSAKITEPGVVKQFGGAGDFFFGYDCNNAAFQHIGSMLKDAKIKASLVADITRRIWEKYIFVCSFASVTTAYNISMGEVIKNRETRELLINLIKELKEIAYHERVLLPDNITDSCISRAGIIPYEAKTSMQIDFELGKKTEIDIFTEYIVNKGKEYSIPTPHHCNILRKISAG